MARRSRFSQEVRERAVRRVFEHGSQYGSEWEAICRPLPVAASTYDDQKAREADPSRLPKRAVRDAELREEIERVGNVPPAEFESMYDGSQEAPAMGAGLT